MVSKASSGVRRVRIRKAPGRYHHGDLKEALVVAAEQQVARTGSIDLSLREVAYAAGVSHAAAYRHFKSKTDLLAELARRGFAALEKTLVDAIVDVPKEERLVTAGVTYVRFATASPGLFRVMFHPSLKPLSQHPGLLQAGAAALAVLRTIVAEMTENAQPWHAMAAWASIHGQAVLQLDQQLVATFGIEDAQAEEAATFVLQTFVEGLRAKRRARP